MNFLSRLLQGRNLTPEFADDDEGRSLRPPVAESELYNPTAPSHPDNRELWSEVMTETWCVPGQPTMNTASILARRQLGYLRRRTNRPGACGGRLSTRQMRHITHRMLPVKQSSRVVQKSVGSSPSRGYITHFSMDGSKLICGFQSGVIRVCDATSKRYKTLKVLHCENIRWTVTDLHTSPCHRFVAYSTISPVIQMVNVSEDGHELKTNMVLTEEESGIWSFKFSSCGTEIIAGGRHDMHIYNIEYKRSEDVECGHKDDINTVEFADESSNIIFSGSDDALIKVWDRRCLNRSAVGALVGHREGITFVSSKGDGRYILSNGKDQTMKLWDIRRMTSNYTVPYDDPRLMQYNWDYRWMDYPGAGDNRVHPDDASVATFRGHSVLQTLIRCYFSPAHSTGQRFAYTGSQDGRIYVYDIASGKLVRVLTGHSLAVRDVTWHPFNPIVVSTSWDGVVIEYSHISPDDDDVKIRDPDALRGEPRGDPQPLYDDEESDDDDTWTTDS